MAARSSSSNKTKKKTATTRKTASTAKRSPARATSTRKSSTSSRKSSPSTRKPRNSSTTTKKTITQKNTPQRAPISPTQRVDIAGILLIVVGLLLLVNLLNAQAGPLTLKITSAMQSAIGWGAYALPLVLLLLGTWFLLSKMESFPRVTTERVIGTILLFFNTLTWFQVIHAAFSEGILANQGGGRFGSSILSGLIAGLGKPGTMIVLLAWLLVALVLLVDLSLSNLIAWLAVTFKKLCASLTEYHNRRAAQRRERSQPPVQPDQIVPQGQPQPISGLSSDIQESTLKEQAKEIFTGQKTWVLPMPERILSPISAAPVDEESDQDRARVIEETLRSFNAPAHVVEIRRGPTITMFGVEPDFVESRSGKTRVRVSNIVRLADDLAMALKASRIRIQAPVPGKGYIGIEVPNQKVALVSLLEIVQSLSFRKQKSLMKFPLGKDVAGVPFTADLASMPHLLIAGTTGSGKSVCVNAILAGYLLTLTPDQLRIVLVDPKRVELTGYNGIPHLLAPVITDAEKVVGALQWMLREMDLRYRIFSDAGRRNIDEYNAHVSAANGKPLPYLLVVIDELADLMMLAPDETERSLTRLAQLARATGIHLILATQRPSTDILTGLIKANFPARIAFAVASNTDSRVILDQPGAERLLGRGDMLFQAPDAPAPVRLQGTYVSDDEINRLTDYWREQAGSDFSPERPDTAVFTSQSHAPLTQDPLWQELEKDPDEDPITQQAILLIRKEGRASISMLQRKMRIGYTRSARLIEKLEEDGIIGPASQSGTREVLDWGDYPPLKQD